MSDRLFPQLTDGIEWNIVGRRTLQATQLSNGKWYIPPQNFVCNSFVIQVGLRNTKAASTWYLGAWAYMSLFTSPSSTTEFVSSVTAANKSVRLGVLNLLVFPKLVSPWLLELRFPSWHEEMYVEVWQYDGEDVDVFQRLLDLEQTIENSQP